MVAAYMPGSQANTPSRQSRFIQSFGPACAKTIRQYSLPPTTHWDLTDVSYMHANVDWFEQLRLSYGYAREVAIALTRAMHWDGSIEFNERECIRAEEDL